MRAEQPAWLAPGDPCEAIRLPSKVGGECLRPREHRAPAACPGWKASSRNGNGAVCVSAKRPPTIRNASSITPADQVLDVIAIFAGYFAAT